jgi:hypothetical protein
MKPRSALVLAIACAVSCTPPPPQAPAAAPVSPPVPPVVPEAQLSAAPPASAEQAPPASAEQAPPAPSDPDSLVCISPPDPELDKESPWHKAIGEQLSLELPNARRCTSTLPEDTRVDVTLRLVYGQDGRPLSQHVLSSSSEDCSVAECIKQELADVNSGKLAIERGSIDLALVLERGKVPQRSAEPTDPLVDAEDPSSCIDPDVARLSRKVVRELVSTTHDKLKQCYGHALARRRDAAGTVTFEFVIGQEGEMASVQARESTLYDCAAIECMLAELKPLRFPAPVGRGVRVVYPIKYVLEQPPVRLK